MAPDEIAHLFEDLLAVENLTIDRVAAASQGIDSYRR